MPVITVSGEEAVVTAWFVDDGDPCSEGLLIAEVQAGWARPLVTREYFSSLRWKMSLRVLSFIAQYREIAQYRGEPIHARLDGRWVLLDPVGTLARWALRLASLLGCSA